MSRRLVAVLGAALATVVVLAAAPHRAQADDSRAARSMLERAREATAGQEFDGTVLVEWSEGGKRRQRTVSVHDDGGVLRMGDNLVLGAGSRRLLRTGSGWQLMWSGGASGSEPDPSSKYRFDVSRAATVAHRPATRVVVMRSGAVRERMFFDNATGIMLRRDQLDANGRLARRFTFVDVTSPHPKDGGSTAALPKVDPGSRADAPHALADLPDNLSAPKRVGNGFVLSGVYSQPDGSVQLYYSDGLLGLSVFEREGELDWGALPAGGRTTEIDGRRTRVYATAAGTALVWGHDDVTYTCVTDASLEEVTAVAADLSPSDGGALEDAGRFVTAPFSWG
jgi:sigma-E factor negative regulatory protein RseB